MSERTIKICCPEEKWFKFDTWTVKQALLFFSGVNPSNAVVEWSSHPNIADGILLVAPSSQDDFNYHLEGLFGLKIKVPFLRSAFPRFMHMYLEEPYSLIEISEEELRKDLSDKSESIDIPSPLTNALKCQSLTRNIVAFKDANIRLQELFELWMSRIDARTHYENELKRRLSLGDFYRWIVDKKLQKKVPWWDEAISRGLINDSQLDVYLSTAGVSNETGEDIGILIEKVGELTEQIPEVLRSAEHGQAFKNGRSEGSIEAFSNLMSVIYEREIQNRPKLTAKDLWEAIPEDEIEELGLIIQDKVQETESADDWIIYYQNEKQQQKELTFPRFKHRFTDVKKRYNAK